MKRGLSFVAMDAEGDQNVLFNRLRTLALLKKHQQQCSEWVGLGWDMSTDKVVDVVFYAAFEPQEDAVLDEIVASDLGKPKSIDI